MKTILLILSLTLAACAADEDACDPTGSYQITIWWDAPAGADCGIDGSESATFDVTQAGEDYVIDAGAVDWLTGAVYDDGGACLINFDFGDSGVNPDGVAWETVFMFRLHEEGGAVAGDGGVDLSFSDGTSCSQGFTVTGSRP